MRYICIIKLKQAVMTWNELRKIAEAKGWVLKRHGSRHDIYCHPDKDGFIQIGRHGKEEIRNGTCAKLKKDIGF